MTSRADGRRRVVIDGVEPEVDGGAYPIKRVTGDSVDVRAYALADGHDQIACMLRHREHGKRAWAETPMQALGNDTWQAAFEVAECGKYEYTVTAWIDHFLSWRHGFERRREDADIASAIADAVVLVREAAERAAGADAKRLQEIASSLDGNGALEDRRSLALSPELVALMRAHPDRSRETAYPRTLECVVERALARFSTWYELFPRSCTDGEIDHGTFAGCRERLSYVAEMGFDVLYLPPIHPIGRTKRKGPNNALAAGPDDPGSPWAIGAASGGHKSVHPRLGTLEDFRALVADARRHGIEIALDIAFQCSPDHPYVREHPEWFKHRADGGIQYAENPPKKYEDIYPFDFECEDWQALWSELRDVIEFWIEQGVSVFRVDNPHTKPFPFWEWVIDDLKSRHPQTIFLAEAFARPRVMYRLAKLGFSQSYTYFTWRNTKQELVDYFTEINEPQTRDWFRPNLWPNTPDILHEYLQFGGRPAFMCRAVLAATLSASYGIYGPPFELLEQAPREPGSEEYLDSEKYQVRRWDLARGDSLHGFVARLNKIRRENPALQTNERVAFREVDNDRLVCYSRETRDLENVILVVANLDPYHAQSGHVHVPLDEWGIDETRPYQAHDLLSGARYLWHGARNYVSLDPQRAPAHVFRLRRHVSTERDFDYFM